MRIKIRLNPNMEGVEGLSVYAKVWDCLLSVVQKADCPSCDKGDRQLLIPMHRDRQNQPVPENGGGAVGRDTAGVCDRESF
jgi:hypothetical protein